MNKVIGVFGGVAALSALLFISSLTNVFKSHEAVSDYRPWILVVVYGACCIAALYALKNGHTSFVTTCLSGLVAILAAISVFSAVYRSLNGVTFRSLLNPIFSGIFICAYFSFATVISSRMQRIRTRRSAELPLPLPKKQCDR